MTGGGEVSRDLQKCVSEFPSDQEMATIGHPAWGHRVDSGRVAQHRWLHMTRKAWSVLLRVPTLWVMPVTIDLPAETQARLEDEASRWPRCFRS